MTDDAYHRISTLGYKGMKFAIRFHPVGGFNYVLRQDIASELGHKEYVKFLDFLKGQTVPIIEEGPAVYAVDLNRFLLAEV